MIKKSILWLLDKFFENAFILVLPIAWSFKYDDPYQSHVVLMSSVAAFCALEIVGRMRREEEEDEKKK